MANMNFKAKGPEEILPNLIRTEKVPVPDLLSVVQLGFCVCARSSVESSYEERPLSPADQI